MHSLIDQLMLIARYSISVGMNGSVANMRRASVALTWGFALKNSPPWKCILVPPLLLPWDKVPQAEDEDLCLEPGTEWSELLKVAPLGVCRGVSLSCRPEWEPARSPAPFSCKKRSCVDPTLTVVCFREGLF